MDNKQVFVEAPQVNCVLKCGFGDYFALKLFTEMFSVPGTNLYHFRFGYQPPYFFISVKATVNRSFLVPS